ncbi:unnamed protein product [Schistosoma mattheei]|uniref:Uncharacterized protein n=1 Tax=Schistosoma mattheei TaxID=31246 RepID=A0A183NJX8_9TREM|nr:unnamed protein product [Schistosoma mattheei]
MWSIQPRPSLKSAVFSGVCSSRVFVGRQAYIEANISDAMFVKLIPLWLLQDDFDPFLYIGRVSDCDQSDGMKSNSQILAKILANLVAKAGPPYLNTSQANSN